MLAAIETVQANPDLRSLRVIERELGEIGADLDEPRYAGQTPADRAILYTITQAILDTFGFIDLAIRYLQTGDIDAVRRSLEDLKACCRRPGESKEI